MLEAVAQIDSSGICQTLMSSSQACYVKPKCARYAEKDNELNKQRFLAMMHSLGDNKFLLLKTQESEAGTTEHFLLIPNLADQNFLMIKVVPSELMLPDARDDIEIVEEIDAMVQLEIVAALKKIPEEDYFDPLTYKAGLIPLLEAELDPTTRSSRSKKRSSITLRRGRGHSSASRSRGRGRSVRRGRGKGTASKVKYNPVV